MDKKEPYKYHKSTEANDLLEEMNRIGLKKFREMMGQEVIDAVKKFAAEEDRINPIRQKIRLQAKLKGDYPLCEKCVNWGGVGRGRTRPKPCPFEHLEKSISFEKNELCDKQSFEVEVCEMFEWVKEKA